jgi:glyoxylase-like metal-dependent hydrolase (beta-lactamase superfamily II)
MKVQEVGSRGYVFTFEDPYKLNIYVINGDQTIFFCDTGFGSDSVDQILEFLEKQSITSKPFIAFNSHADYDHVWGNHIFEGSDIIAHELSPEIFEKEGEEILELNSAHKRGDVILTPPNRLFKDRIVFEEEGVEFYHSPGHTLESSSCFDIKEKILFVGDNIESPFPYVNFLNLDEYIETLEKYLARNAKIIISGHDEIMYNDNLIRKNLEYLEEIKSGKVSREGFTSKHKGIHYNNVKRIAELSLEVGEKAQSLKYYLEVMEILEEAEKIPAIEEEITKVKKIIDNLS